MEDKRIVDLLWERSREAIPALAQRFGGRLQRTAMNILGNPEDAEEAVNDTYLALWDAIPPQRPDPLEGYVYRTGRNVARKKLRFQSAQKRMGSYDLSLDELSDILPGESIEDILDARALGQAIDRFLATLSKSDRILFLRRYWFGDRVKDLARERFTTENALSVRLSRLRQKCKDHLIKEGFFDEAQEVK